MWGGLELNGWIPKFFGGGIEMYLDWYPLLQQALPNGPCLQDKRQGGHSMGLDMYNDMYPLLQHHTEQFHCPENPLFHHASYNPTYVPTVLPPAFIAAEWNAKKGAQNKTPNSWV